MKLKSSISKLIGMITLACMCVLLAIAGLVGIKPAKTVKAEETLETTYLSGIRSSGATTHIYWRVDGASLGYSANDVLASPTVKYKSGSTTTDKKINLQFASTASTTGVTTNVGTTSDRRKGDVASTHPTIYINISDMLEGDTYTIPSGTVLNDTDGVATYVLDQDYTLTYNGSVWTFSEDTRIPARILDARASTDYSGKYFHVYGDGADKLQNYYISGVPLNSAVTFKRISASGTESTINGTMTFDTVDSGTKSAFKIELTSEIEIGESIVLQKGTRFDNYAIDKTYTFTYVAAKTWEMSVDVADLEATYLTGIRSANPYRIYWRSDGASLGYTDNYVLATPSVEYTSVSSGTSTVTMQLKYATAGTQGPLNYGATSDRRTGNPGDVASNHPCVYFDFSPSISSSSGDKVTIPEGTVINDADGYATYYLDQDYTLTYNGSYWTFDSHIDLTLSGYRSGSATAIYAYGAKNMENYYENEATLIEARVNQTVGYLDANGEAGDDITLNNIKFYIDTNGRTAIIINLKAAIGVGESIVLRKGTMMDNYEVDRDYIFTHYESGKWSMSAATNADDETITLTLRGGNASTLQVLTTSELPFEKDEEFAKNTIVYVNQTPTTSTEYTATYTNYFLGLPMSGGKYSFAMRMPSDLATGSLVKLPKDMVINGYKLSGDHIFQYNGSWTLLCNGNHTYNMSVESDTYKVSGSNATCTTGATYYLSCACGAKGSTTFVSSVVDATAHSYGEPTYVWSGDNATCTATRICTNNSEHTESEIATITPNVTQQQSCETDELTTYTATFTNNAFATQTKANVKTADKTGHSYGTPSYVWSEDNTTCTATRTCVNDSAHVETETVNSEASVTQQQSCTLPELTTYTATFENSAFTTQTKTAQTKAATGHDYEWHEEVSATCTSTGTIAHYTCSLCDKNFNEQYVEIGSLTISANLNNHAGEGTELVALNNGTHDVRYVKCGATKENVTCTSQETYTDCTQQETCVCGNVTKAAKNHTFTGTYYSDGTQHWQKCTCGAEGTKTDCDGGTATCTSKAVCETCQKEYGEEDTSKHTGTATNIVSLENGQHEVQYTCCNAVADTVTCASQAARTDCTQPENCYDCGYILKEMESDHAWSNEWSKTSSVHWKACTNEGCEQKGEESNHTSPDGNCETEDFCDCGYQTMTAGQHTFDKDCTTTGADDTCSVCGAENDEVANESHTLAIQAGTYEGNTHMVECTVEGCDHEEEKSHTYDQEVAKAAYKATNATCSAQATYYKSCACGKAGTETFSNGDVDATAHSYGAWNEVVPATCTATGTKAHKTCTLCGKKFNAVNEEIDITIAINPDAHTTTETKIVVKTATTHEVQHSCCDAVVETVNCSSQAVVRDCTVAETCVCGNVTKVAQSAHDYTGAWQMDEEGHWHVCTRENCDAQDTKQQHGGNATCVAPATCPDCEKEYGVANPANHSYGAWNEEVPATCTETGTKAYQYCSLCEKNYDATGNVIENLTIAALGHNEESHDAKAATCTEIGWNAYVTCSRCAYTTKEEIAAKGHDEVNHDAKEATCTEKGWNAYVTCSRCDYTTYEEIEALGHDEVSHEAKAATCTEIGWNAYVTCSRCDYTTKEEIAALGHDGTDCSRCDYRDAYTANDMNEILALDSLTKYTYSNAIPAEEGMVMGTIDSAKNHGYLINVVDGAYVAGKEATHNMVVDFSVTLSRYAAARNAYVWLNAHENGYFGIGFMFCFIESNPHLKIVYKASNEKGEKSILNEAKFKDFALNEIQAFTLGVVQNSDGSYFAFAYYNGDLIATGTVTNKILAENVDPATHNGLGGAIAFRFDTSAAKPAAVGKICDLTHEFGEAPVCQEATCTICGDKRVAKDHAWSDGVKTGNGSCTVKEVFTKTCTVCRETDTYEGNFVHDWETVVVREAACNNTNRIVKDVCKDCKKEGEEREVPGTGIDDTHNFVDYEVLTAATCVAGGTEQSTCSRCGALSEITATPIDDTAHTFGAWNEEVPASCTATGTKAHKTCTLCNKNYDADGEKIADLTIAAKGHTPNSDDGDCTTAITCSVCGATTTEGKTAHTLGENLTCSVCGKSLVVANTGNVEVDLVVDALEMEGYWVKVVSAFGDGAPEGLLYLITTDDCSLMLFDTVAHAEAVYAQNGSDDVPDGWTSGKHGAWLYEGAETLATKFLPVVHVDGNDDNKCDVCDEKIDPSIKDEDGGCGSSLSIISVLATLTICGAAVTVARKRED